MSEIEDRPSLTSDELAEIYRQLIDLGVELASERSHDRLLEKILMAAKLITKADGGTLYLVNEEEQALDFKIVINESLNFFMGGTSGMPISLPSVKLYNDDGTPNLSNVASSVYHEKMVSSINDAYADKEHDFSGTRAFDQSAGYHSKSFLTVPLINSKNEIIAIIQLINALNSRNNPIPFSYELIPIIKSLSSQAAVALDNELLIAAQRKLWDALIQMLASSIDDKSPYTGGHCQRVPELTKMLAKAATKSNQGIFRTFNLNEDDWYELHVAAWLHDCGKITTPEYIVDKASKLETLYDRIHEIRTRFELLYRDAKIEALERKLAGEDAAKIDEGLENRLDELQAQYQFVAKANVGGEFMDDEDIEKLKQIGAQPWTRYFDKKIGLGPLEAMRLDRLSIAPAPAQEFLLSDSPEHFVDSYNRGEIYNLSIKRGTLTEEERKTINDHIVVTIKMLNQLPFPKHLKNVPEIAGGHHEKMDGTGYPNGLKRDEMSIPARIMAIADIFEALTAADRPYKQAKTLSESLNIMKRMAETGHIDPDLYQLFITDKIWLDYAEAYLFPEQIDEIDVNAYLLNAQSE